MWEQIKNLFSNLLMQPDWHTYLDLVIVAFIIYEALSMLLRTRANSVIRGVVVILVLMWLADLLQFNTLSWLFQQLIGTGVILLVILFQPELRRALEQLGRRRWSAGLLTHNDGLYRTESENIRELVTACVRLAKRKVGALIVIQRSTGLQEIIESGTILDAEVSAPLLENIFEPNTPLHDGAVVMRGGRIIAAGCILQLSDNGNISKDLGTRHRAAIGISETADSISVIVSEETGIISVARDGRLTRYLDENSLTELLSEELIENESSIISNLLPILKNARKEKSVKDKKETTKGADTK